MKKHIAGAAVLIASLLAFSAPVSAHHADLTGETFCLDDGWEVIWTADPSNDRNLVMIEADGWQVSGLWVASTSYFQHTTTHTLDEASATMTVDFWWAWGNPVYPNSLYGPITETTTIERPTECTVPATTSTTTVTTSPGSSTSTSTTAPTTTAPETTSTSSTSTSSSSTTSTVPDSTSTTTSSPVTLPTTTTVEPSVTTTGSTPSSTSPVTGSSLAPAVRQPPINPTDQTLPETGLTGTFALWAALFVFLGCSAMAFTRRP